MIAVRELREADATHWHEMWESYVDFYEATVPALVTASTFSRLIDPASSMIGRVATVDSELVGFSASVVHPATWSLEPVCYLEDLFVSPHARGQGVGLALIQDLVDMGRKLGWARLYWHTRADNTTARRLYDKITSADDFVRYRLQLN